MNKKTIFYAVCAVAAGALMAWSCRNGALGIAGIDFLLAVYFLLKAVATDEG